MYICRRQINAQLKRTDEFYGIPLAGARRRVQRDEFLVVKPHCQFSLREQLTTASIWNIHHGLFPHKGISIHECFGLDNNVDDEKQRGFWVDDDMIEIDSMRFMHQNGIHTSFHLIKSYNLSDIAARFFFASRMDSNIGVFC